ncbi:MAG: DUF1538 family protein [Planctomycetes bacterium]|nr:DUF1538 family protein [Planctomycetota bacterium]
MSVKHIPQLGKSVFRYRYMPLWVAGKKVRDALADLLPIILVIGFFQLVVLRQPLPQLSEVLVGAVLVVAGLSLFVQGLEMGLFPIGEK